MLKGIIILEGPDGTGKTTLGQHIADRYNGTYIHCTYNEEIGKDVFGYHTNVVAKAIADSQKGIVCIDRLWLSEMVYGEVFRGGSKWPWQGRMLQRVLNKHCAATLFCMPHEYPEAVLTDRFERLKAERNEMFESVGEVTRRFVDLWNGEIASNLQGYNPPTNPFMRFIVQNWPAQKMLGTFPVPYDFERQKMEAFANQCVQLLQSFRTDQRPVMFQPALNYPFGYLPLCLAVMVGETPKDPAGWPYYGYTKPNILLAEALTSGGIPEDYLTWVNSYDLVNKCPNTFMLKKLANEGLPMIAIGEEPSRIMDDLNIRHGRVTSPEVLAMMENPEIKRYGTEIRDCIFKTRKELKLNVPKFPSPGAA